MVWVAGAGVAVVTARDVVVWVAGAGEAAVTALAEVL